MFALLAVFGDSARMTPGRPEELVMQDAGVLKCPMCHVPNSKKQKVRWDMHGSSHGMTQMADASGYSNNSVFARQNGTGGPVDCMSNPGGKGCAGPH